MIRIGFLGPRWTFSQEAVKEYLKIKQLNCKSFEEVKTIRNMKDIMEANNMKNVNTLRYAISSLQ